MCILCRYTSLFKYALICTGGGQYAGDIDPLTVRVMDIIRPAVEGLSNALDSDCVGIGINLSFVHFMLHNGIVLT
jgi:hypothetical protein